MQAMSIYILILLDEGEKEDNNLDYLMVVTVAVRNLQVLDYVIA
jgi:hypothetical protein